MKNRVKLVFLFFRINSSLVHTTKPIAIIEHSDGVDHLPFGLFPSRIVAMIGSLSL